ncbi:MAG: proline--tRNA ligase, partial [Bacteroidetes bacterium HGW-Bacteroidetes-22]
NFAENWMAVPVLKGVKSPNERFAGAIETFCIEAMMQDGKALQAGTSHFLGQNFAKAFDVKFLSKENQLDYVWATSWGVSTRLMGALVMSHSDDNGLVLPPKLAPIQVVIIPIYRKAEQLGPISEKVDVLTKALKAKGISVKYDSRDSYTPGWKFNEYEFKGVPVRVAIGPRDIENGTAEVARRDNLTKEIVPIDSLADYIANLLDEIQVNLFERARSMRNSFTKKADTWEEFVAKLDEGGFIQAHWDGTSETEQKIKDMTKATIRLIPLEPEPEEGRCILTGNPSPHRVLFARAY